MHGTVLIIDDDSALVQTLHDVLEMEGIQAIGAADRDELVLVTAAFKPDVILLDLMLAATSGFELAAELREGPYGEIPRIAMSSSPFMLELAEESELFKQVVPKPVDLDVVVGYIAEEIDSRQMQN